MHTGTFLKTIAVVALTATTVAGAGIGSAQAADRVAAPLQPFDTHNWELLFGLTATSQYISRGLAQSSGPAFQPWAELDVGPLYLGYWGSNTDPSLTPGSWENDLTIGLRFTPGPIALDVGYLRYVYDTGDCCGEIYGKASINPIKPLTLGAAIFYNPDGPFTYIEGNGKLMLTDMWSVSGAVGSQDGVMSWNAGLSFAVNDSITLDGRYHAGLTSDKFVVSIAFATSLKKFSGGRY